MKLLLFRNLLPCLLLVLVPACKCGPTSDLEIEGSGRFKAQVRQALVLLQQQDLAAYEILTNNVGRIQEGEPSGMQAYATPPVYVMSDVTAFYSLTWCAATIAHDSFHSKLYHDYQRTNPGLVPDSVWMGRAAEQKCMSYQIEAMRKLGSPEHEISYARTQADGHYVTDAQSWQEYRNRNW